MNSIFAIVERMFWSLVWLFLLIIIGFTLLRWLRNVNGPIGSFAGWVASHAEA